MTYAPGSGTADDSSGAPGVGIALSWASIGLAVLTAIFQGLVAALAFMTESSTRWTFRFRLARVEHVWWSFVSLLLLVSLVMSIIAFTSGMGGDPVSVLALSSASFLAVVQYTVPAWHQRSYIRTPWYAWTGDSRTTIRREYAAFCGDALSWARLLTASDYFGWRLWSAPGVLIDPTDLFRVVTPQDLAAVDSEKSMEPVGVYPNADAASQTISLRWGRQQNFGRRVSRAVASMPLCLLRSSPTTSDGYDGKGLANAMGIMGRNKGLQPWKLVFKATSEVTGEMENVSTWAPRPAKVLRSFYRHTLSAQYHGLGEDYVNAAVELALLLADIPSWAVITWLQHGLEHQCLETSLFLSDVTKDLTPAERAGTLSAHYESSYVSMIVSLNAFEPEDRSRLHRATARPRRPDVICTRLLMYARGREDVSWWARSDVQALVVLEEDALAGEVVWKTSAAKLLGLAGWPKALDAAMSETESESEKGKSQLPKSWGASTIMSPP